MMFQEHPNPKTRSKKDEAKMSKPDKFIKKNYLIDTSWIIPNRSIGQAVSKGWGFTDAKPNSVTWHWTATWDRAYCDKLLGGSNALRKPKWNDAKKKWEGGASAHYCVGRDREEGISQYVSLEDRSWHAGAGQSLRWDGKPIDWNGSWLSGSRTSVGVETVNIGFARASIEKQPGWIQVYSTNGQFRMWVPPWGDEQIDMMSFVGRKIIERYPNIKYLAHHGHMDICPGYKEDCSMAFPFARVLSNIYEREIPDVWGAFKLIAPRQKALKLLGYNLGSFGVDGDWGRLSDSALRQFQEDKDLVQNGHWTTFVCWEIYFALVNAGFSLESL